MLLEELFAGLWEARKNPDQNPKLSAYEVLKKYKDRPNTFVHFTNHINQFTPTVATMPIKFGVNTKYKFNTPMGIYGYPIDVFWEQHGEKDYGQGNGFAMDRPYIVIFEWSGEQKYLPDMSAYSEADWEQDYKKLLKLYPAKEYQIGQSIQSSNIKGTIGKLWNATRWMSLHGGKSDSKGIEWNHVFRRLGYSGFNDTGEGAYSQFEYPQAVFFSKPAVRILDVAVNKVYDTSRTKRFVSGWQNTQSEVADLNKLHRILGKLLILDSSLQDIIDEPVIIDNTKEPINLTNGTKLEIAIVPSSRKKMSYDETIDIAIPNQLLIHLPRDKNWAESPILRNAINQSLFASYTVPVVLYDVDKLVKKLSTKEAPFSSNIDLFRHSMITEEYHMQFNMNGKSESLVVQFLINAGRQRMMVIKPQPDIKSQSKAYALKYPDGATVTKSLISDIAMPGLEESIRDIYDKLSGAHDWIDSVKGAFHGLIETINTENLDDAEIEISFSVDKRNKTVSIFNKDENLIEPIWVVEQKGNDLLCYNENEKLVKTISDYKSLSDDELIDELIDFGYMHF